MIEESSAQLDAIAHPGGPLLILAAAGTGKTHTLVERFAWLAEHGTPADAILALTFSSAAAGDLRERLEQRVPVRYEELSVSTFHGFCARLLRDEAIEAGIDPFAAPVTPSDRLAMLLERIDELPLASHDLRGNPSALLGSIVQRIDRLKDELITAGDYEAWAATLPEEGADAGARARVRGDLCRPRPDARRSRHARLRRPRAARVRAAALQAARARAARRPLPPRARRRAPGHQLRPGLLLRLLVAEHGNVTAAADEHQSIHRFRGAATKARATSAPNGRMPRSCG